MIAAAPFIWTAPTTASCRAFGASLSTFVEHAGGDLLTRGCIAEEDFQPAAARLSFLGFDLAQEFVRIGTAEVARYHPDLF